MSVVKNKLQINVSEWRHYALGLLFSAGREKLAEFETIRKILQAKLMEAQKGPVFNPQAGQL